jgi:tetratricopeptide (TPR) repeat protein
MLPGSGEARMYLGIAAHNAGHWDQSIAYFEQAVALDPRNVQILTTAALSYANLRQFPAALKLCDRVLDIRPTDADAMANKARIYQALGNLEEAARLLTGINETSSVVAFEAKASQLQFERNYGELLRLQQARVTRDGSDWNNQINLALYQWLAGDTAGAKVTAKRARDAIEQFYGEERRDPTLPRPTRGLSQVYALMGEKDLALQTASSRGAIEEENLALIQAMTGGNSGAISTLTHLLQTPYRGNFYGPAPVTPALLRLDPFWDALRSDPAFQKLCEEKQDLTTNGH